MAIKREIESKGFIRYGGHVSFLLAFVDNREQTGKEEEEAIGTKTLALSLSLKQDPRKKRGKAPFSSLFLFVCKDFSLSVAKQS